jgi:Haem-binding uptake, Tiki superfamily, ChaN
MRSGGPAALPATTAARLGLDVPMPREAQSEMESDLRRAHCGHGAAAMIERMALIQRARDAQMALSLTESDGGDGAVLITGAGHARVDRGVPMHLRGRRPSVAIVSVAFVEVSDAWAEPTAYAASTGGSGLPFDYVWFTPRVDAPDPCRERARPAG